MTRCRCNLCMTIVNAIVCQEIIQSLPQSCNVADWHGVREPLVFVVILKGHDIGIERRDRRFAMLHKVKRPLADPDHGQSRRRRQSLLRASAENVDLALCTIQRLSEHARYGVHHAQDPELVQDIGERRDIVDNAARRIAVNQRRIAEVAVLFQICFQSSRVHRIFVIRRVEHRFASVDLYEICKALAEDAVIYYEHSVAWLRQARTGCLQSQDALASHDDSSALRV